MGVGTAAPPAVTAQPRGADAEERMRLHHFPADGAEGSAVGGGIEDALLGLDQREGSFAEVERVGDEDDGGESRDDQDQGTFADPEKTHRADGGAGPHGSLPPGQESDAEQDEGGEDEKGGAEKRDGHLLLPG